MMSTKRHLSVKDIWFLPFLAFEEHSWRSLHHFCLLEIDSWIVFSEFEEKAIAGGKKVIRENKTAIWTWTHLNILDYYFITVLKKKNTKTNQIFFFLKLGAMLLYILQGQTIKADSTFKTAERRIVSLAANSVLCMPAVRLKCMVLT